MNKHSGMNINWGGGGNMLNIELASKGRVLTHDMINCDLAVIGGGLAGVCCAITAAREGLRVVLVQDRPVLGGNASSEVRLWALGATSHLGSNNRWSREGGVIDEIIVENLYRNPQGNPVIFDTVVLDKVVQESNITLLLNTAVFSIEKHDNGSIKMVRGLCPQNSTLYEISAPLFCDASGDGIVGYLAGAEFRMGAESSEEFGEKFAPSLEYGALLGHSIFFYSRDTGKPVKYIPPSYALDDITKIPRYRNFTKDGNGCQLWWLEYGGRLDTIYDSEKIKWELWKIVYGVWNHIKNSGDFPGAETMTLEWVGLIPGKRESRRFVGDYMLIQQDIVEQRQHYDAVSYGGWAIDLHPSDGVYSNKPSCDQWHSKGLYQIPYRCMYSKNIHNLFLAGRIISTSHVANGSTRVMMTCAHNAQAVGVAAAICTSNRLMPQDLSDPECITQLQQQLLKRGQYIPGFSLKDKEDLVPQAEMTASSCLELSKLVPDGPVIALENSIAMVLPMKPGPVPTVSFEVYTEEPAVLTCELRVSERVGSFTPDVVLESKTINLLPGVSVNKQAVAVQQQNAGRIETLRGAKGRMELNSDKVNSTQYRQEGSLKTDLIAKKTSSYDFIKRGRRAEKRVVQSLQGLQTLELKFDSLLDQSQYVFICLKRNPAVSVRCSQTRITGLVSASLQGNHRVNNGHLQKPSRDIGVDTMEFWVPQRWPDGHNLSMSFQPPLALFGVDNLINGVCRPTLSPNAWVADVNDSNPSLTLKWKQVKTIRRIELSFDTDWNHPMESVLMGHPRNVIPYCVRKYRIFDALGKVVYECKDNHQTRNVILLDSPVTTDELRIELLSPDKHIPVAVFEIRCYE